MAADYVPPVLYRIAVLNEFRNNFAYVDFKQFGEVKLYAAFWTAWPHRGCDVKDDRICVFLNYDQKIKTANKNEAEKCLSEIIEDCPGTMCGFLADEQYKLYRALWGD